MSQADDLQDARDFVQNHVQWLRDCSDRNTPPTMRALAYHANRLEESVKIIDSQRAYKRTAQDESRKVMHLRSPLNRTKPFCRFDNQTTNEYKLTDDLSDVSCRRCQRYAVNYEFKH